jgi:aminoglycoside phosphotransferase (APT) family kinase protein
MASDALVGLVSRALRIEVEEAGTERIATAPLAEVDRIRWRAANGSGTLVFKRLAEAVSLEAHLLPFLSRRGVPVPRVVARGVPPARANERRPWLLMEDVNGSPLCDALTESAARQAGAMIADLQEVTRTDEPALRALGVPRLTASRIRDDALEAREFLEPGEARALSALAERLDPDAMDGLGVALVHGDYGCASILIRDDTAVVVDWARAHLGCPLLDMARLTEDLRQHPRVLAAAADAFGAERRRVADAQILQRLFEVRWYALLANRGLMTRVAAAQNARLWLVERPRSVEG